jgi:hypothetical protein
MLVVMIELMSVPEGAPKAASLGSKKNALLQVFDSQEQVPNGTVST